MRFTLPFAAVVGCFGTAPSIAPAAAQSAGSAIDVAAINAISRKYEAVFNKGDARGAAAIYAVDAVFTNQDGSVHRGRGAIAAAHAASLAGAFKGTTIVLTPEPPVFLKPDVATVRGGFDIVRSGKTAAKGVYLVVLVKTAAGWLVTAQQSMVPAVPPPAVPAVPAVPGAPANKKPNL